MATIKAKVVPPQTIERIASFLNKRNTSATAKEIAVGSKSNPHTVRKLLGVMLNNITSHTVTLGTERKCRVSGNVVKTYQPRTVTPAATKTSKVTSRSTRATSAASVKQTIGRSTRTAYRSK